VYKIWGEHHSEVFEKACLDTKGNPFSKGESGSKYSFHTIRLAQKYKAVLSKELGLTPAKFLEILKESKKNTPIPCWPSEDMHSISSGLGRFNLSTANNNYTGSGTKEAAEAGRLAAKVLSDYLKGYKTLEQCTDLFDKKFSRFREASYVRTRVIHAFFFDRSSLTSKILGWCGARLSPLAFKPYFFGERGLKVFEEQTGRFFTEGRIPFSELPRSLLNFAKREPFFRKFYLIPLASAGLFFVVRVEQHYSNKIRGR